MEFPLPTNFNGMQFAKEIGVSFFDVWVQNDVLFINAGNKSAKEIETALAKHKPIDEINHRASALSKLIDLGLTEEEIAAL